MLTGRVSVGHPVDIATGIVYSTYEDISIPGKVDLTWERLYTTPILDMPPTPLGPGWTNRYFSTLKYDEEKKEFQFFAPEGYIETFADPDGKIEQGETIRNLGTFQELYKREDRYIIAQWDVETGEVERYVFKEGRKGEVWSLASIEDVTGQGLDMLRDSTGRLTGIQQRLEKRTLVIEYTANNQVKSVSFLMPDNQRQVLARYEYHNHGRLATAYDALGYADRYEYDDNSCMTREVAKDGGIFYFKYDEIGRCIKTSGLDRYDEKSLRYLDYNRMTEVTNSLGYMTRYQWNENGQVVCEIDPLGGTKRTEYDEHGRIIAEIDANGAKIKYEYDDKSNRHKIIDPIENETLFIFNTDHLQLMLIEPTGNVWNREYDVLNRLIVVEDPLENRWVLSYDTDGNLIQVTNPNGIFLQQLFSPNGIILEATDWGGNVTRYAFDDFGRVIEITEPSNYATRFHYDLLGNTLMAEFPDGSQMIWEYDNARNVIKATDGNIHTTIFHYGPCRRLLEIRDTLKRVIRYQWGSERNLLEKIINEKGEIYSIIYNETGQIIREIGFDGREIEFIYDLADNCVATINALNEKITYVRDITGKLIKEIYPDGSYTAYEYNVLGYLVSATNPDCEVRFKYDSLGRLIEERQGDYIIESQYDAAGNLVKKKTSLGCEITYDFESNGFLSCLIINDQYSFRFLYNTQSEEITRLLPGNIRLEQKYNPMDFLSEQHVVSANLQKDFPITQPISSLIQRQYEYDQAQALTTIKDLNRGSVKYIYDPTDYLMQTLYDSGSSESFTYDLSGNLTRISDNKTKDDILEYTSGDRLIGQGNTKYIYDKNGRLIIKIENYRDGNPKKWEFSWNVMDNLKSIRTPEGDVWEYSYDAFGRRILKKGQKKAIRFVWDQDVVVHQLEEKTIKSTWIFDLDSLEPLCTLQEGSVYSFINNHLGTPLELISYKGNIVWSISSSSWGEANETKTQEIDCPIRFLGHWFDEETGLHYNRFRYYDPQNGRFISPDPIRLNGGLNLYTYVRNPIGWIDPYGLKNIGVGNEGNVEVHAFPGPQAAGTGRSEHRPLHAHLSEGRNKTRVLMEDYYKNGKLVGRAGQEYPGDPPMTRNMRRAMEKNLAKYSEKAEEVYETGKCKK